MMPVRFDWDSLVPWVDLLAQSSLLLAMVLLIGRFLVRGSAARNILYRAGVLGLLLLPVFSIGSGWTGMTWRPAPATRSMPQPAPLVLPALPVLDAPALLPPVVTPSTSPAPRALNISRLLWLLWVAGSGFMLLRLAVGLASLRALLHKAAMVEDTRLHESLRRVCAHLRVRPPKLVRSALCRSPFLAGLRGAAIVLPERLPQVDSEKMLAHEAAHLARGDCRWTLLSELARALFFWQPLAWLLARRLTESADLAADNVVLELGGEPGAYASQLAALAGCRFDKRKGVTVMGTSGFASSLRCRVKGLLATESNRCVRLQPSRTMALGLLVLMCALLTACLSLHAKEPALATAAAAPAATDRNVAVPGVELPSAVGVKTPKELRLDAILKQEIPAIALPDIPLQEAIELLRAQLPRGVNFFIDPAILATTDIPVTLDVMKDVTVSQVLDLMLKPRGLDYMIQGNVIYISTVEGLLAITPVELRVYDVKDFMGREEFLAATIVTVTGAAAWDSVTTPTAGGAVPGDMGLAGGGSIGGSARGGLGRDLNFDSKTGLMTVNNSAQVHRQVEKVIGALRAAMPPERLAPGPAAGPMGTEPGGPPADEPLGGGTRMPGGNSATPPTGDTTQPK